MRRFIFTLLCLLMLCLPTMGEELEITPSADDPAVYYMRAEYAGHVLYEYGLPWVRRDGAADAPLPQTLYEFLGDMRPAGENMALIDNADPRNRLHLRARPDKNATSRGKYYSGTPVEILDCPNDVWAHVRIGTQEGYMQRAYLAVCDPAVTTWPNRVLQIQPGSQAVLRAEPSDNARAMGRYYSNTPVTILESNITGWQKGDIVTADWCYVRIGTQEGYLIDSMLRPGALIVAAPPVVTIQNPSGTGLNLRATPKGQGKLIRLLENGERVTVLGITENYLHVQAGTDTGFIKNMGTVPALDYHSSDVQPAFKPFSARIRDNQIAFLSPRIYAQGDTNYGGMISKDDDLFIYGIYGMFAAFGNVVGNFNEYVLLDDLLPSGTLDPVPQIPYDQLPPEFAACFDNRYAQHLFVFPEEFDYENASFLPIACIKGEACMLCLLSKTPEGGWQLQTQNDQALLIAPELVQTIHGFRFIPPSQYLGSLTPGFLSCYYTLLYEKEIYSVQVMYDTDALSPSGFKFSSVTITMPQETQSNYLPKVKYDHLSFAVTEENTIVYSYAYKEETSGAFYTQPLPLSALDAATCRLQDIINAVSLWKRAQ